MTGMPAAALVVMVAGQGTIPPLGQQTAGQAATLTVDSPSVRTPLS